VTVAIGSERLRFTLKGPGGHSWGDAEAPSAILGAARLVTALYNLELPRHPRTTLSVGTLRAGHSVNSIAAEAVMDVDLRSVDQGCVVDLRKRVLETAEGLFPPAAPIKCAAIGIGSRPAGVLPSGHPLLDHVQSARAETGLAPAEETSSSTDANIPLSRGIPAVCVGVGFGQDAHKRSETLEITGLNEGCRALRNLVTRLATDRSLRRSR
jgi:tripeptide aminopeptidase